MKKPYYLLIPIVLLTSLMFFASSYGPDNPLSENVYEYKGRGFAQLVGAGVNNTVPQTANLPLPAVLLPAFAEQAYLYADLHCEISVNCTVSPSDNATAVVQGNSLGETPPYDYDEIEDVGYWNIYRWDITEIVRSMGGIVYSVTIDSPNNPIANIGNVLIVAVYNDTTATYRHIILNDGIEVLMSPNGVNQTTTFSNVGPSFNSIGIHLAVTGGDIIAGFESVDYEIPGLIFGGYGGGVGSNIWNSTDGPSLDIHFPRVEFSFLSMPVISDINVTVGTGPDDIGWEVALLEADLRDVSADSQTHSNAQVVQGSVESINVVVSNNGNPNLGVLHNETFDVTLYYDSNPIGIQTVTDLVPGSSETLTYNWDTSGVPPGTYAIMAWADSADAITEFNEDNNNCTDPLTIRIMTPPDADADGPYEGYEGSPITFDASGSTDQDGSIVLYEWDFDDDGTYDWSGPSTTTDHIYGDDYNGLAMLRVTDNDGLTDTDTANVNVKNVNPIVDAGEDQESLPGHQFTEFCFEGTFTDLGWLDTHTAEWNFGDGSPPIAGLVNEENNPPDSTGTVDGVCHSYWVPYQDTYTVTLTVEDDDGGVDTDTLTVTILRVIGGEEMPLDIGSVLASVLYSYWWIPTLMAMALLVVYVKKRCQ